MRIVSSLTSISRRFILSDYIQCYHHKGQNQHFVCVFNHLRESLCSSGMVVCVEVEVELTAVLLKFLQKID